MAGQRPMMLTPEQVHRYERWHRTMRLGQALRWRKLIRRSSIEMQRILDEVARGMPTGFDGGCAGDWM